MKMYLAGEWVTAEQRRAIRAPYSGEVVDEVPEASTEQVEQALTAAAEAAKTMRRLSAYERSQELARQFSVSE
jgi:acyl-CoA reductase-like NAD-dependent aldehyde dehydrogenase